MALLLHVRETSPSLPPPLRQHRRRRSVRLLPATMSATHDAFPLPREPPCSISSWLPGSSHPTTVSTSPISQKDDDASELVHVNRKPVVGPRASKVGATPHTHAHAGTTLLRSPRACPPSRGWRSPSQTRPNRPRDVDPGSRLAAASVEGIDRIQLAALRPRQACVDGARKAEVCAAITLA